MNTNDFANKIGLSRATVWRAINGNGRISPETRKFVLKMAAEMGLKPSRTAQALRSGQTRLIELWIPHLDSQFSGLMLNHVQNNLRSHGFDLIVRGINYEMGLDQSFLQHSPWPVDGILAIDPPDEAIEFYQKQMKPGTPLVNMGVNYSKSHDSVVMDECAGTLMAMNHLIKDVGCKRLVSFTDEYTVRRGFARYDVAVKVAKEAGIALDMIIIKDGNSQLGLSAMEEYLSTHTPPDGVFCFNDSTAIGIQLALSRHGVRIPEETAMVGFDGLDVTEFLHVPLTTVRLPISGMCTVALEFLQNRLFDPSIPHQQCVLEPELVIRESSTRI